VHAARPRLGEVVGVALERKLAVTTRTPASLLGELSAALGLNYEPQDWGIVNADADRLDAFVAFFRSVELEPTQRFEMADLILASANEALLEGREVSLQALLALASEASSAFEHHLAYWAGLTDESEFPLGAAIRQATAFDL
jgi:hypothetical protein